MTLKKTVYAFDALTRRYTGPVHLDNSDRCQITGEWHVPGNCLDVEPPAFVADGQALFESAGQWERRELPKLPDLPESVEAESDNTEATDSAAGLERRVEALEQAVKTLTEALQALQGAQAMHDTAPRKRRKG